MIWKLLEDILLSFNRAYELVVDDGIGQYTVTNPFRIQFSALKSVSGGLNKLNATLYGLGREKRERLVKDREEDKKIFIALSVGYQGQLQKVFGGQLHRGFNKLTPNSFVTSIELFDGGFDSLNSYTSKTVYGGESSAKAIIEDMPNTTVGIIEQPSNLIRPRVLVGNSGDLLKKTKNLDQEYFIDDGKVYILATTTAVSQYIPLVNASTGLMDTPSRERKKVMFTTLFNPYIKIAGLCKLESLTSPHLDGTYRIEDITYNGDNNGNDWSQTCSGYLRG